MRAYTACLLIVLAVTSPGPASAGTDARVTSVSAQLDVRDPSLARVELAVRFLVKSELISSFDLEGLDPDFDVIELEAPSTAGAPAIVRDAPGQLQLLWTDPKSAPHAGEHGLRVLYATRALYAQPRERGPRQITWTLPRWPERLTNVEIRVLGPAGLMPDQIEPNYGEQIEVQAAPPDAGSAVTYRRAELPRLTGYRVQFSLPQPAAADETPLAVQTVAADIQRNLLHAAWLALIGACFGGLILAKRRVRRARLVTPQMLIPRLEPRHFDWLVFALAVLAPLWIERMPLVALAAALLAVASALEQKRPRRGSAAADGGEPSEADSKWLSAQTALDATTPAGALCLAALLTAALFAPEPLRTTALICGWLATPLFFSGTAVRGS